MNILGTFIATRNTATVPMYVTLLTLTGLNPTAPSAMMNRVTYTVLCGGGGGGGVGDGDRLVWKWIERTPKIKNI